MSQTFKQLWLTLALSAAAARCAFGFALLGPVNEPYQVPALGYNLIPTDEGFFDIGAPKNIGQGYRWNSRNIYYAYDASFFTYFGSDGGAAGAIDQAFAILNALTNYSAYPPDLGDLPLDTRRINFSAQALNLIDVKSLVLSGLLEELGLAQPERYVFTLHAAFLPPGAVCPNFEYIVIQRNFDPEFGIYSSYVNGVLYSYIIEEFCGVTPDPVGRVVHQAVPIAVDPNQDAGSFSSVASQLLDPGTFYTGLTRDDVGGLRYLMATNRIEWEIPSTNSFLTITNNSLQLLETSNLNFLATAALTNPPATLQGLFPGLVINSFTQGFSNIVTTNIFAYITNFSFSPPGSATLVVGTNFTTNVIPVFFYQFGNVITNNLYANGLVTIQTISNGVPPFSPPGTTPVSITNNQTFEANFPNGTYFLLPTNALCGFSIVSTQLITVTPITNIIVTATIAPGTVNSNNLSFTESIITYSTNYFLIVSIPQCSNANGPSLFEGVDHLNFFRHDFDSLLGTFWSPITNSYTLTIVTNNAPITETYVRVVTQPDILITSSDLSSGPGGPLAVFDIGLSTPNFNNVSPITGGNPQPPGPGTMQGQAVVTLNRVGTNILSIGSFFVEAGEGITPSSVGVGDFNYGSFDGTTNPPVIYPSSFSLSNLESQVFLQILLSGPLPNGHVGVPYLAQLQASGFQLPFSWSVAPNSPALPPGLNPPTVHGADTSLADLSGTPTAPGIYDFDLQVQDSSGRVTQRNFTIEIDP
jgi:hypothetical protein